ncbi:uncharacterized protein VTP21DRAFT_5597 [Calcarisporiella thermophila]|uniref:uncharacterized protein n=1 Tax=Calcarisporiella thermophila TaxID=911321 RepID=UPI0037424DFC
MDCPHIATTELKPPGPGTQVYKEECTQCFDSQDSPLGIDVCLFCFNAGCLAPGRAHSDLHYQKTQHPIVLNIRRVRKEKPHREGEEPPNKITRLAITPENEQDLYDYITQPKCLACGGLELDRGGNSKLSATIDGVLNSLSAMRQSEVKAWEEEIYPCEHTLTLVQEPPKKLESQALAHCNNCELKENLWLCLVCGNLGCGRRQYDGTGGNGHALDHFKATGHSVNCKLGTITPEGTADIYCYACDDAKIDNDLAVHLANFGINVANLQKTEKSMTELQLEQNLKFDFSMTTEDGKELEALSGPGYTGLKNLGNSCYMASVLQSVFSLEPFQNRYLALSLEHPLLCPNDPANCLDCQLVKLADGLLSGRYSVSQPEKQTDGQDGITPRMFKNLIGRGHAEFSTMRQQDAFEFFQHLVKTVHQRERANGGADPTHAFQFMEEQRLQCLRCNRVRYTQNVAQSIQAPVPARKKPAAADKPDEKEPEAEYEPVTLAECLDAFVAEEVLEYNCPHCLEKTQAKKSVRFATFPQFLVVNVRRFELENWVPRKLPVPILIPSGTELDLGKYQGKGQQPGEELLPEEDKNAASIPQVDPDALAQLEAMGFPRNRCEKALLSTENVGAEVAMNWLLEHMEDPDIDAPIDTGKATSAKPVSEQDVAQLCDMGFTGGQAKRALRETDGNMERAVEWLFSHPDAMDEDVSMSPAGGATAEATGSSGRAGDDRPPFKYQVTSLVSHKGPSVHCGHYVAHVLKNGQWVLFNDEKVAAAEKLPEKEVYLLVLTRV